ncbi:vacuolar protein sorting-associated protein 4-like isoform X2 [Ornithodoros turicata]|uniref:vacuolar protein sorting-associated protein 4-like isoform X2 n=1 Tax=Ornithodoros turicata TaxID=34597 RepID=UPI0031398011
MSITITVMSNGILTQLQEARRQVRRAIRAEVVDENFRKALGLYVLANRTHLDILRKIRAFCAEYTAKLRDLRAYVINVDDNADDDLDDGRPVCHLDGVVILGNTRSKCPDVGIALLIPKITSLASLDPLDRRKAKNIRKILLYGPSATGKTCLPLSLADSFVNSTVFYVVTPLLLARCRQRGDTTLVKAVFDSAQKHGRSVICFDDLDALCSSPKSPRDEERLRTLKAAWLSHMAIVTGTNVLVLGVVNNPWLLDDDIVAKQTEGLSGTHLSLVVNDAVRCCKKEPVTLSALLASLGKLELRDCISRSGVSRTDPLDDVTSRQSLGGPQ